MELHVELFFFGTSLLSYARAHQNYSKTLINATSTRTKRCLRAAFLNAKFKKSLKFPYCFDARVILYIVCCTH